MFNFSYVLEFMKKRNLKINDDWKTPKSLYDSLDKEFHFDFDPCPFKHDITLWNGLNVEWGNSNFVNPPYYRFRHLLRFFMRLFIPTAKYDF